LKDHQQLGRLALREEGDLWNAYYALPDSMKDAIFLGSIKLRFTQSAAIRQMFMDVMREAVADLIEEQIGGRPVWGGPKSAPFWERKS
jgi:hypothetical protein